MGVKIPVATTSKNYNFTKEESKSLYRQEQKRKKWQKQLARQLKGSHRREKTKRKISATYEVQTNIRVDRAHKITYELVDKTDKTILVLLKNLWVNSAFFEKPVCGFGCFAA